MKFDSETGNITSVDYETHEVVKGEYESKIKELKQHNEDLEYDNERLERQVIELNDDIEFLINVIEQHLKLTDLILKKRFNRCTE